MSNLTRAQQYLLVFGLVLFAQLVITLTSMALEAIGFAAYFDYARWFLGIPVFLLIVGCHTLYESHPRLLYTLALTAAALGYVAGLGFLGWIGWNLVR